MDYLATMGTAATITITAGYTIHLTMARATTRHGAAPTMAARRQPSRAASRKSAGLRAFTPDTPRQQGIHRRARRTRLGRCWPRPTPRRCHRRSRVEGAHCRMTRCETDNLEATPRLLYLPLASACACRAQQKRAGVRFIAWFTILCAKLGSARNDASFSTSLALRRRLLLISS